MRIELLSNPTTDPDPRAARRLHHVAAHAVEPATADERTRAEITALLTSFLSPEQNPTRAAHERFWADDLVYTSSAGKVTNKAEILKSFDEPAKEDAAKANEPEPVYSADDILVRPYGEMAALTFRLVARAADGAVQYYRNSGTVPAPRRQVAGDHLAGDQGAAGGEIAAARLLRPA